MADSFELPEQRKRPAQRYGKKSRPTVPDLRQKAVASSPSSASSERVESVEKGRKTTNPRIGSVEPQSSAGEEERLLDLSELVSAKRPRTDATTPFASNTAPAASTTRSASSTHRLSSARQSANSATKSVISKPSPANVPLLLVTVPTDSPPASKRTHSMLDVPHRSANSSPSQSRVVSPQRAIHRGADRLSNAVVSSPLREEESSQPKKKKRMMSKEMGKKVVRSPSVGKDEGTVKKSMEIVVDPVVTVFHANVDATITRDPGPDSPVLALSPRKAALSDKSNLGRPVSIAQLVFRPPPVVTVPTASGSFSYPRSSSAAPSPSRRSPTKLRSVRLETPKLAIFRDPISPVKISPFAPAVDQVSPRKQDDPLPLDTSSHFIRPSPSESVHSDPVDAPQLFNNDYSTAQFDDITPPFLPHVDDTATPEVEPADPEEGELIFRREGFGMDSSLVLETHSSVMGDPASDGDDVEDVVVMEKQVDPVEAANLSARNAIEEEGFESAMQQEKIQHPHQHPRLSKSPSAPQQSFRRIAPAIKVPHLPLVDYDSSSSDVSVHEVILDAIGGDPASKEEEEEHDFIYDDQNQNDMDLNLFHSDDSQPATILKFRSRNPLIDSDTSEDELSRAIHNKMSFRRSSTASDDSADLSDGEIGQGMKAGLRIDGKPRGSGGRYNQILEEAILAEGDSWDPLMIDLEEED